MAARAEVGWSASSGETRTALWLSESLPPPPRLRPADDRLGADEALRLVRAGTGLVWTGDYHGARQLLAAMGRRLRRRRAAAADLAAAFRAERRLRLLEHTLLGALLVPVEEGWRIPLPRAPLIADALGEALGAPWPPGRVGLVPLREVLGAVGSHEWRRKGVHVPALGARVFPHHGVFAPVRGEHVDLVARGLAARAIRGQRAFDIGTGTGVLAILLARAGASVIATDVDARAVACARENALRLGVADRVEVVLADLFPPGRADLVLSNPPWIPAEAHTALDRAIYDPRGEVLSRLVGGLQEHLAPGGEAWIVSSDLAELLGLRPPGSLLETFSRAGLAVARTYAARPTHPRAGDARDPLHAARARETTTLYCLTMCRGAASVGDCERSTRSTGRRGVGGTSSP